jgi:hypothetical protein
VCESLGLNPLTQPFQYVLLGGRLVLYARKDACDQLRKIHGVSLQIVEKTVADDLAVVHVRATAAGGRSDEDLGAVSLAGLKGEARCNAILKAITKAKRRVTLSICGLGFLDETEVAAVPDARPPQLPAPPEPAEPPPASAEQRDEIGRLCEACGVGDEEYLARLPAVCGQADPARLTGPQAKKVLRALRKRLEAKAKTKGETQS